jgi:serine protease inhibitor
MKTKEKSIHSPKNKFRCEINFKKAIHEIGSVESFTANSIEEIESGILQRSGNIAKGKGAYITIMENLKTYPEFEWKVVKRIEK